MNTKSITTAALMVALSILISYIMYLLPFFQGFMFLIGLPIVVLGVKYDLKIQLLAALALGLLMAIIDPLYSVMIVTLICPMGILQGVLIKKKFKPSQIIFFGAIAFIFGLLIMLYLLQLVFDTSLINELKLSFDIAIEEMKVLYDNANFMSEEDMNQLFVMFEQSKDLVVILLPTVFAFYGLVSSIGSFILSRIILKKLRMPVALTKFKDFRIDKNARNTMMIVLIVVTIASYIDKLNSTFYILNAMMVLILVLQINGLSLLWYLTEKHPNRKAMRISIIILFVISPLFGGIIEIIVRYGISAIGFIDMYFDFRTRLNKE